MEARNGFIWIKIGKFLDQLSDCYLFKKVFDS